MPDLAAQQTPIAVTVLTGFLGSGKTTLLNRLLRAPGMDGSVVIVNEFGEVGLDHLLIEAPEDETILLKNGCLCCVVLGDLVMTLTRLLERRDAGDIQPFDRIVIETSGLADPSPLLQTIVSDIELSSRLDLSCVVTVVDAVNGLHALDHHRESVKQAIAADRIVLSKTDIAACESLADIRARLTDLNPGTEIIEGPVVEEILSSLVAPPSDGALWQRWLGTDKQHGANPGADAVLEREDHHGDDHGHAHHHGENDIRTVSVTHDEPATRDGLRLWLNALSRFKGPKLLRVKGIVNVDGAPYAVNAVQRVFHEPYELAAWPGGDTKTRIVFIVNGLDADELAETTGALEFRPSRDNAIVGLSFNAADYRQFVRAMDGFSAVESM